MSLRFNRLPLLVIACGTLALAQSETAALRGTVTDPEGAPLDEAVLVITDVGMNVVVREITTGRGGAYYAPYLKPGRYRLTIEKSGFQGWVAEGILLAPGEVRRLDPKLVPGSAAETTTVEEPASLRHPEGGTLREQVDYKARWNDAPMADFHPSVLPLLTTASAIQGNRSGLVMSGISSRDQQTWALDGVPHDTTTQSGNPSLFETVEVAIANPGAEASRPVYFNMVSKRGGEGVHGLAYYKRGASGFNARSYFDRQKPSYWLTEAAGELAMPLIPNWTHLYGGGMYQKLPYSQTRYADVPTEAMRSLDFSAYLSPDTAPGGKVVVVVDPRNGRPFSSNRIPANRLSSVTSKYLDNYYPKPNAGDAGAFTQNYAWDHRYWPDTYNGNWPFVRFDQKFSTQNQFYVRWLQNQAASVVPGSVSKQLSSTQTFRYRSLTVSDVHALSWRLVNQLKIGRTRYRVKQGESEGDVDPMRGDSVVSTLGLQGVNPNGYSVMGFPAVAVSGLTGLSMGLDGGHTDNTAHNDGIDNLEDSITWSFGSHAVKAGVQYMQFGWQQGAVPQTVYGSFDFTGAFTGLGFADFVLGLPATSARRNVRINRRPHQRQTGAFLADSFRVSSRLTLDYGVRWDYYGTPVYDDGYMCNWDPASGNVIVAPGTLTSVSAYYPKSITVVVGEVVPKAKLTNIRPRVAASYHLSDNLVVRGGYGEFTENLGYGAFGRLNSTNPFALSETYTNSITGFTVALSFPKPFPTNPSWTQLPGQSVTALPATTDEGVIRQYSATVEWVARDMGLRVSYVGSRGAGMNYSLDVNKPPASATAFTPARKPYPQFASTDVVRTDGQWRYDSVVFGAHRRTGPLTFNTNFTWANNRSSYANTTDPYNVTKQWTRDASTRRRYWVTSLAWPVPAGKGRRVLSQAGPVMNRLVSDWSIQAIATFASGQYYSPLFTGPDPANASQGFVTQLPDCVGDSNAGARTLARWFNPGAFAVPPAGAGRYGNCGMNILEGYPIHVGHVSLAKRLPLGEFVTAVFTVQASNITNTPHFTIPNNNISNPNPGMFTASSLVASSSPERLGARQLAFKLRLEW